MQNNKLNFLRNTYPAILKNLDPETIGMWGKMNVQQMIEHMCDSVKEGNGKISHKLMISAENVQKAKAFLMSEKEFRPNTKNVLMGEEPAVARNGSVNAAIEELELELADFENYFRTNPDSIIMNPFFGDLNFDEWTQLLHKHAIHHLKQFGVGAL